MKYFDQHTHCHFSVDSNELMENYLFKAKEFGLSYLVFTDHLDYEHDSIYGDWIPNFDKEFEEAKKLNKENNDITIKIGIEAGYMPQYINKTLDVIKKYPFNVVNFSSHIFDYDEDIFLRKGFIECLEYNYQTILEMVTKYDDFDVLTHIDYCYKQACLKGYKGAFKDLENYLISIMNELIKKDKSLEVNMKVQKYYEDSHIIYILNLYKSLGGVNLTLSSDAHVASDLCYNFDHYIEVIKSCGFNKLCYYIDRKKYYFEI